MTKLSKMDKFGVYISQIIRYSRACGSHNVFLGRELLLTMKLINKGFLVDKLKSLLRKFQGRHQGFLVVKVKSSLRKVNGRHHDLVNRYGISVSQMTTDMFHLS
jgi:hypothetical protein